MSSSFLMAILGLACLLAIPSCATNDSPPVRRVSAEQFMRPHMFKGVPTDQFIGTTESSFGSEEEKAFKAIWEMGLFHGWAILWCPVDELPNDYLKNARQEPNRI